MLELVNDFLFSFTCCETLTTHARGLEYAEIHGKVYYHEVVDSLVMAWGLGMENPMR
jgi:hypothetical protein